MLGEGIEDVLRVIQSLHIKSERERDLFDDALIDHAGPDEEVDGLRETVPALFWPPLSRAILWLGPAMLRPKRSMRRWPSSSSQAAPIFCPEASSRPAQVTNLSQRPANLP